MTDVLSSAQIVLEEAGYAVWLVPAENLTVLCFEDEAILGFVSVFDDAALLLDNWRRAEASLLSRYAPRLREAEDKAWNVYSVFLCGPPAAKDQVREIRRLDEDLERTRKVAACGLAAHEDVVSALLPVLPIQYRPSLEGSDLTERLLARIAAIAPAAVDVALDDDVPPSDVVRLLGETP